MGKRSDFSKFNKDFYRTPYSAIPSLLPHLPQGIRYAELCAGVMDLVNGFSFARPDLICTCASDLIVRHPAVIQHDATTEIPSDWLGLFDVIITNPPWTRDILHKMIMTFIATGKVVWLLFDADWFHTEQARPFIKYCTAIVTTGRHKWIPGTKHKGKDNACWYRFDLNSPPIPPLIYGRL